jgi:hypothetical protein
MCQLPLPFPLCLALSAALPAWAWARQADDQVLQAVKVTAVRADGFAPKTVAAGSFHGADTRLTAGAPRLIKLSVKVDL